MTRVEQRRPPNPPGMPSETGPLPDRLPWHRAEQARLTAWVSLGTFSGRVDEFRSR